MKDYFDQLSAEERALCKEVVLAFAASPFADEGYHYQITDGTEPAITSLPRLLAYFPEDHDTVVLSLFCLILNPWEEIANAAIMGVCENLWEISFTDAHSLLLGFLLLKQKYDTIRQEIRRENYQKDRNPRIIEAQVITRFEERYEEDLERIVTNEIAYDDLKDLEQLDLETLTKAFALLPLKLENEDHKAFVHVLLPVISKHLFQVSQESEEYAFSMKFLKKCARFLLSAPKKEIGAYLQPVIENFQSSERLADFFTELIAAQDHVQHYEEFWVIWNACYEKIVELAKRSCEYDTKSILRTYLLAWPYWNKGLTEWHSLRERETIFFGKAAQDMGHCPIVLYSLSKVLHDIGSHYLNEGISWLSTIVEKNENLLVEDLETNTLYYIESLVRRYITKNRLTLRTNPRVKRQVITILNFLVERGSTTGYWLRDDIL